MRSLDPCDNGCHAPAVKWTSQGYVCHRCANALDRQEERYRKLYGGPDTHPDPEPLTPDQQAFMDGEHRT